jgi:pimeloyl-ACP methyl ester carboxylesterase
MEKLQASGHAPVNGLEMYYEIHGNGAMPLVLIHGGGSTIETTFGNMLPLFSAYTKVIAVELQAHGRTSDRDAPESFEQDADDVAALLKYLKVDKADILGFSNGGTTTLQIAIRHPQVVNKIVVISGAYERGGFMPGFFEGFPNATLAHMPEPLKAAFLKVTPDKSRLQVMFEKDVQRMQNFTDVPHENISSIKAPALFISADHDVMIPEHTTKMWRAIAGARLAILPGNHGQVVGETGSAGNLYETTVCLVKNFLTE